MLIPHPPVLSRMSLGSTVDVDVPAPANGAVASRAYRALEALLFVPFVGGVLLAAWIMGPRDCTDSFVWAGVCGFFVVYAGFMFTLFPVGLVAYAAVEEEAAAALETGLAVGPVVVLLGCVPLVYSLLLFLDARRVRAMDVDWTPSPLWYPLFGYVVPGLAVLHYLSKRHKHVGDDAVTDRWWPVLLFAVALVVFGFVLAVVLDPVALAAAVLGLALGAAAAYKNAASLASRTDWDGSPVDYAAGALFTALALPLWLGYVGYYAYRRRTVLEDTSA